MDYLAFDPATNRVWVPAGNGKISVIDTATGKVELIEGFASKTEGKRTMGPSSASVGEGFVYVGNRADSSICAVDSKALQKKGCVTLESSPDGLQYVAVTKELWVTTPRDKSITFVSLADPAAPKVSGKLTLEGDPEGYAIDTARGIFYTNLEDKDRTLAIDAKAHKILASWNCECGEKGPRGLALDEQHRHLFVACATEGIKTLDVGKDGAILSTVRVGEGVDNIDWLASKRLVYAATAKEGKLVVIKAADDGKLTVSHSSETIKGGRTVLIDAKGNAYIPDSKAGRIFVVEAAK